MAYDKIYKEPFSAEDLASLMEDIDIEMEKKRAKDYGYAFSRMETGMIYYGENTAVGCILFLFPSYMGGKFIVEHFDMSISAKVCSFINSLEE